ncbi:MAG TPA: hypothetical protein VNB88_08825 [Gaiellaceae bacterium]|jgi:hypothetical protein|nr:hypothetical protein [Gaiellaceae bacterium]
MRSALRWGVVALGSAAGLALWRRSSGKDRERVELYFSDGSMVSFPEDSTEAARLIPLARQVLTNARG